MCRKCVIRPCLCVLLFFAFLCLLPSEGVALSDEAFLSRYRQTVFSDMSNLPITQANAIVQARNGYIWIASYDGLVQYDGRNAILHDYPALPTRNVTAVYEDFSGRLWIGTNDSGVVVMEGGRTTVFDKDSSLSSNSVRAITGDDRGNVYVATVDGLACFTPELSLQYFSMPTEEPVFATSVALALDGSLWCSLNSGGVVVFRDGALEREYAPGYFYDLRINTVARSSSGAIYLGSNGDKVVRLTGETSQLLEMSDCSYVNKIYEDVIGRVWTCCADGFGYFYGDRFNRIGGAMIENNVRDIMQDSEGNYWLASDRKGVLFLSQSSFQNLSFLWHLPELTVNATCLYDDLLYIAADEGLFAVDSDGKRVENDITSLLQGVRVRDAVRDEYDNLWLCTYSNYGLLRYRSDGTLVSLNADDGMPGNRVRCATPYGEGGLLAGTMDGLAVVEGDQVVRTYTSRNGLRNAIVLSLVAAPNGDIFVGSDGEGIYRIAGDEIENYSEADGLSSGIVLRMAYDPVHEGIWVSLGNGIGFLGKGGYRHIEKLQKQSFSIFEIKPVGDDAIWFLGSSGLYVCSRNNIFSDDPLEYTFLDKRDGLDFSITANSWSEMADDGTIYIACTQGVVAIDTQAYHTGKTPPRLAVNSVEIDDTVLYDPEKIVVPADAKRVTFNYSLLSYANPTGNHVSVFLEGFDRAPHILPTDLVSQVSYTNLKGGTYKLHLNGINRRGLESGAVTLPMEKEYATWEKPHMRALLSLVIFVLLAALFYAIHTWRTRAIVKRKQEYYEITNQAIAAIADTIDAKDKYTSGHSKRVAEYSRKIAYSMGFSEQERENLYYAALLHDIGKIGLEDRILNKQGKLDDEEYAKMKNHVEVGGDILKSITVIENIATGAKYHHERYDGRGYGSGLKGEGIPLYARIICVADAYDAMSTNRPYRGALTDEYILGELEKGKGAQFDADVVTHFLRILREA